MEVWGIERDPEVKCVCVCVWGGGGGGGWRSGCKCGK